MTGLLAPDAFYGQQWLFKPDTAIAWARALLSSSPRRLVGSRSGIIDVAADRGDTAV